MTVVPIKDLPLGFRFHPTDEELVNHYLKRKINGKIRCEIEVIPEIDVCKCEPWDLPARALIQSDDPEWFFFSPKDRKYPNGHRSNRATEAGYWKATGKDRFIRSKAPAMVIGMKKTLVFHRGRAPKGVRTNYIMHEYRTTEPEFESGEQGGYVLYRLFRKPEESAPVHNVDDMDRSELSITPHKSSPSEAHTEIDAFEEHETPAQTPLNQVYPISYIQENINFQDALNMCDNYNSSNSEDGHINNMTIKQKDSVDPLLLEALGQMDSDGYLNIISPIRTYDDHSFLGNANQELNEGMFLTNFNERDPMDDFLNSILSNGEESPSEGVGYTDPGWFMDASNDYSEINRALYENVKPISNDIAGYDDYSVDSGSDSLQGLFSSMDESNSQFNFENTSVEENGITGIRIRPRQPSDVTPNNMFAQQGYANRRIRLQVSSVEYEAELKQEDNEKISETEEVENKMENEDDSDIDDALSSTMETTHADDDDDDTSISAEESKPNLRLRRETPVESVTSDERKDLVITKEKSRHRVSFYNVLFMTLMMMMVLLLSVGMWTWKSKGISGFVDF